MKSLMIFLVVERHLAHNEKKSISRGAESVANQITQPALGVESKSRLLINWPTLSNFIFNPTTGNLAKALFAKRNRKTLRRSVNDRLLKSIG